MLVDQVRQEMNLAAKAQNVSRLQTLRLLLSSLEYKKMQKLADLSPEEEIAVIKSEVKKRQEAIEIYEKASDQGRLEKEKQELEVLMEYMPSQVGEDEIRKVVEEVVSSLATPNRGQVIGMVIGKIGKEKVDGTLVARVVNEVMN